MKTQISRNSHRPQRRYSGVYQQQGRMITDADWNELMQLVQSRLQAVLKDVIGSGMPNADKGLRLERDTAASELVVNILAGNLYADGLYGTLLEETTLDHQADLPLLPLPVLGGGQDYTLYADLWERSVTALEDEGLLDAGLHGADTTTRTQTMVQVKWCPAEVDPEAVADNPPMGDALLSLTLRTVRELDDECDPCAIEIVQTQEHIGNYLFRVEVHQYTEAAGERRLVLKWSSENGAEQYVVGNEPVEFTEGPWVYEFFHRDSEKYLGTHFAPASADYPYCPSLHAGYPASPGLPVAPSDRPWLVRRWDGYCELTQSGTDPWVLAAGKDKVHTLTTDPARSGQDGFVELNSKLLALLGSKSLELEVELDGSTFVRGDYWLCAVREALHTPGDTLLVDAPPEGVRHHYLRLAELQADGTLVRCDNDSDCRRQAFPPLTDLRAHDIGYTVPDCPADSSDPPTVQSLLRASLSAWPDLDSDQRRTVKDVLDALLCHLDAAHLPYDPILQQARWVDILDDASLPLPNTVQAAIDDLISKFETSDIWYEHDPVANGACETTSYGADTIKKALDLDPDHDNKIKLNDIIAALLCKLEAEKIPYNPIVTPDVQARWNDLIDEAAYARPYDIQAAIDTILLKLESSDIWYQHDPARNGACTTTGYGVDTLKTNLGVGTSIKLNDLISDLLCLLDASQLPYNAKLREADWRDILDDPSAPLPTTVQEAVDDLVGNIEGSDIGYSVPAECATEGDTSTLKDELGLAGDTDVKAVLDTLLCEFNATDLPVEKNADLSGRLNIPAVVTVQDALNVLSNAGGGGCAVTVGVGGVYLTLAEAIAGVAGLAEVNLCLLPGDHVVTAPLELLGKAAIKMVGAGSAASRVILNAGLHLQAGQVILRDLGFSTDHYQPQLRIEGEQVEASHCVFEREVYHQPHLWSQFFTGSTLAAETAMAVDGKGDIILAGGYAESIEFGGTVLQGKGETDLFLAKFTGDGKLVWVRPFSGAGRAYTYGVAVDAKGAIYLSGWFSDTIDLGGGPLKSQGDSDLFLAKFTPKGEHIWSYAYGGVLTDAGMGLAADQEGNVVLTGFFSGAIQFGDFSFETHGGYDLFLVKFNPDGKPLWANTYGGLGTDYGFSLAMNRLGEVVVAGFFEQTITFEKYKLISAGLVDMFVVKFNAEGGVVWARRYGGVSSDFAYAVAIDRTGNAIVSGSFQGTVDFGGGGLVGAGGPDAFVLKLDINGNHLWSHAYGAAGNDLGRNVVVDRDGNVVLTGAMLQTRTVLGLAGPIGTAAAVSLFVVKYDSAGNQLWSHQYGSASAGDISAVRADADGNVYLSGYLYGTADFGGGTLGTAKYYDVFLVKLDLHVAVSPPLVVLASTDTHIEANLHWSHNTMSARLTEPDREAIKVALAIATANIGGCIEDCEVAGHLILQSDLSGHIQAPLPVEQGVLRIGGGSELTLRGNRLYHLSTRYEGGAPSMDAYSTLQLTDNRFETLGNTFLAQSLTLSGNLFPAESANDIVAIAVAERGTIFGNQARNPDAILLVIMGQYREAANLLRIQSSRLAYYYPGYGYGYAEGIGADLL